MIYKLLRIDGYKGRKILCSHAVNGNHKTAVLFPGYSYGTEAPFFFHISDVLSENGYDIFSVNTRYNEYEKFPSGEHRIECVQFEAKEIFKKLTSDPGYEKFLWIGKSLGTSAIQGFMDGVRDDADHNFIFCTPYDNWKELSILVRNIANKNLVIWGTNDPYYSPEAVQEFLKGGNTRAVIIENLDHGLCSSKGIMDTLDAMKIMMAACGDFIKEL